MSHSNIRRVEKHGGRLPIKAGFCHRMVTWVDRVSPNISCVYNCCKYLLWYSVLMFCYFVCVMPYIVVLARRVGAEKRLQERNRLMYEVSWFHELWWTMKSGSLMLWTVKSPPAVYAQMKSRLCLTFGFVTYVASPIPSWHRFQRLAIHLLYRTVCFDFDFGSWSIFRWCFRLGFFQWP